MDPLPSPHAHTRSHSQPCQLQAQHMHTQLHHSYKRRGQYNSLGRTDTHSAVPTHQQLIQTNIVLNKQIRYNHVKGRYTVSRISCTKVNEFLDINDPSTVSCNLGTKNTFPTVLHLLHTRMSPSHKQKAGPQRRTRSSRQQAGNNHLH